MPLTSVRQPSSASAAIVRMALDADSRPWRSGSGPGTGGRGNADEPPSESGFVPDSVEAVDAVGGGGLDGGGTAVEAMVGGGLDGGGSAVEAMVGDGLDGDSTAAEAMVGGGLDGDGTAAEAMVSGGLDGGGTVLAGRGRSIAGGRTLAAARGAGTGG
jgi:hypothetical protein